MRVKRFDLTRYGKFTDKFIDFGACSSGQPDFHIIYGPNESGKSTLFSAWLDFLYGIPVQSPYNFLHTYQAMRIGGTVEFTSGTRELIRIKRPQNGLLDANEEPVSDNTILEELGGIDREAYCTMFSLDDDSLEQGGESILKAKGDLGHLLFSASSGLSDLSRRLLEIQAEAEKFYKIHARNGELQVLKDKLDRLKQEKENIDTQASKHAELTETHKRAKALYDETNKKRSQAYVRKEEIQRLVNAGPRLAKLRVLQKQLEPLETLPDAPEAWAKALPELRDNEIRFETQVRACEQEIAQLNTAVAAISVDSNALSLAKALEDAVSLRGRYGTTVNDLPDKYQDQRELDVKIAFLLQKIEKGAESDPHRLILSASITGRLRSLIETHSGIDATHRKAKEELSASRQRLKDIESEAHDGAGSEHKERETLLSTLKTEITTFQASAHEASVRLAERASQEAQAVLDAAVSALLPWKGTAEQLSGLALPPSGSLQEMKLREQDVQKRIEQHTTQIEQQRTKIARLSAQQEAQGKGSGLVTDQEAEEKRKERDQIWQEHRKQLDAKSADKFEAALHTDDEVVAQRFAHTTQLAQLRETGQALYIEQTECRHVEKLRDQAQEEARSLMRRLSETILTISPMLPSDWSLHQVEVWMERREKALDAARVMGRAERELKSAQDATREARGRLSSVLASLEVAHDPSAETTTLLAVAQNVFDRDTEQKRFQTALKEQKRDVSARERAFASAEEELKKWEADWETACRGCWLGEGTEAPSLAAVNGILSVIADLASILREKAILSDRIKKMETTQTEYCAVVKSFAQKLGITLADPIDVMELSREIDGRVDKAKVDEQKQTDEKKRLESAELKLRKLESDKDIHDGHKAEMTSFLGVATLAEVSAILEQISQKKVIQKQVSEAAQEIIDGLRAPNLQEAEGRLDAADMRLLEGELADIAVNTATLDQEYRESYAAYKEAEKQIDAIGGDAKAAEIEEARRTVLLEIEDGAQRYMRLRAGIAATDRALRFYREQHRSSMMTRASEALRTISRGAYVNLTTQPDKESEIMVAIAADNSSKLVTSMSKGTRFQLYLALRVAGYSEFASRRSSIPFIADDIMETFDDFRAEEAFRLFSGMAEKGQVIYLTHHRHLCEIARSVCPTVKVHDL